MLIEYGASSAEGRNEDLHIIDAQFFSWTIRVLNVLVFNRRQNFLFYWWQFANVQLYLMSSTDLLWLESCLYSSQFSEADHTILFFRGWSDVKGWIFKFSGFNLNRIRFMSGSMQLTLLDDVVLVKKLFNDVIKVIIIPVKTYSLINSWGRII